LYIVLINMSIKSPNNDWIDKNMIFILIKLLYNGIILNGRSQFIYLYPILSSEPGQVVIEAALSFS